MGALTDRLSQIVIDASSPDGNIEAQARAGDTVDVRFAPGAYRRYRARTLEHQLSRLATLAWTRYRRDYLEITEFFLGSPDQDESSLGRQDVEFWARLEQLAVSGASTGGAVSIRSRALASWEITIDNSALDQMREQQFLEELHGAVGAVLADYRARVTLLTDEIYGLGLPDWRRAGTPSANESRYTCVVVVSGSC